MHPYPHQYAATASGGATGNLSITSPGLPALDTAPPAEFGGPGDRWSPETLFCAAIADCFVLTFRAIARAAKLEWHALECRADGVLDRIDRVTRFTRIATHACLTVPAGTDEAQARQLLEKAEHSCLISNSINAERTLSVELRTQG